MTGQQLKNSILQWAIEGKLVPQIESEGTAEDLLKEIRAEKERLVKEGKLKKKDLEVKPIEDDEIPFEIPNGWKWCRLNDVITYETNLVSPDNYLSLNHIAPDNIQKGTGKLLEYRTVKEDVVKSNNHLFYKGQIIYSKIRPLLRKAIIAPFDGLCSADMYPLRSFIEVKYVLYILLSDFLNSQIAEICSSRVKMPKINQVEMSKLSIPLPPLSEQKRIVSKIEELMPLVEEYGKAQERLETLNRELPEKLKKSVLQEAIMGKLVPQDPTEGTAEELLAEIRKEKEKLVKEGKLKKKDLEVKPIEDDEIPFEIPEGWRWCRLGDLSLVARGGSPRPIKDYITEAKDGVNWIKIGDTEKGGKYIEKCAEKIKPSGVTHSRMVYPGDFLLTNSMSFGRPYICNVEGCIHDGWLVISQYYHAFDNDFLFYLLSSPFAFDQFCWKTAGAVVQNLNKDKVAESIVPLPPLTEQKRIVAKLEEVMGKIEGMK